MHILSECKLYFKLFIVFKKRLQLSQATRLALLMPQVSPGELQDVNEARRWAQAARHACYLTRLWRVERRWYGRRGRDREWRWKEREWRQLVAGAGAWRATLWIRCNGVCIVWFSANAALGCVTAWIEKRKREEILYGVNLVVLEYFMG